MRLNIDAPAMRRINRATVLQFIRDQRTTSRIDIAQMTGLNKATVSYIVDELISEKWVQEIGYGSSTGGRKPMLLRFNANSAYAIGIDVEMDIVRTVVCNTRGDVAFKKEADLPKFSSELQGNWLSTIIEEIKSAITATPKSPHGLIGIGLALPGLVNSETGIISTLPNLSIKEWDIRKAVLDELQIPVFVENSSNCGAWSEFTRNKNKDDNLVFINAGVGIGTGIIINGRLYKGKQGIAGEFGHTTIFPMGQRCVCGNYGCWEEYASERSLIRYIIEAGGDVEQFDEIPRLINFILNEAHADNRSYIRALNTLGQYLGIGITNIINALSPDRISLGGTISQAATFVLPEIERLLNYRVFTPNHHTPITIAGVNSIAIGAATLIIQQMLFDQSEVAL